MTAIYLSTSFLGPNVAILGRRVSDVPGKRVFGNLTVYSYQTPSRRGFL